MLTDLPVGVLAEVAHRIPQDDMLDLLSFSCACKVTRAAALYAVRQWTCDLAVIWQHYQQAQETIPTCVIEPHKRVLLPLARLAGSMHSCSVLDLASPGEIAVDPSTSLFRDTFFTPPALHMTQQLLSLLLPAMPSLQELLLPAMMPSPLLGDILGSVVGGCRGLQRLTLGLVEEQLGALQEVLTGGGLPRLWDLCLEVGLPQRSSTDIGMWDYPLPLPSSPSLTFLTIQLHAWEHASWPADLPAVLVCRLTPPPTPPTPTSNPPPPSPLTTLRVLVLRSTQPPVSLDLSPLPPQPALATVDLTVDALSPASLPYLARQRALASLRIRTRMDYHTPLHLDITPLAPLPGLSALTLEDVCLTQPLPLWPTLTSLSATHVTGCFNPQHFTLLPALKSLSLMDITLPSDPLLWHTTPSPASPSDPPSAPAPSLTALTCLELCALHLPHPLPPLPALRSLTLYCIFPPSSPATIFASILSQPHLSHLSLYHKFPTLRSTRTLGSSHLALLTHLPALRSLRLFECNPHHLPPLPHLTCLRISKQISHPRAAPALIAARYPALQDLGLPATSAPIRRRPCPPSPSPWLRHAAPLSALPHLSTLHVMACEGEWPEATPDRPTVCRIAATARRALPQRVRTTATLDDFVYPSDANIPRVARPLAVLPALAARVAEAARTVRSRLRSVAAVFKGCYRPCVVEGSSAL